MRAQLLLQNPNCLFLSGAADRYIQLGHNEFLGIYLNHFYYSVKRQAFFCFFLGPGSYLNLLEEITKRKAVTLGKPGLELGVLLKQKYDIRDAKRVLFIGDSLETDIKFGHECGFQTLLVLTGATKLSDLQQAEHSNQSVLPDFVIEKLSDLNHLL